jgi:hypothetical protein
MSFFMAGDTLLMARQFQLVIEGQVMVKRGLVGFLDALSALLTSYNVLNMKYPAEGGFSFTGLHAKVKCTDHIFQKMVI